MHVLELNDIEAAVLVAVLGQLLCGGSEALEAGDKVYTSLLKAGVKSKYRVVGEPLLDLEAL